MRCVKGNSLRFHISRHIVPQCVFVKLQMKRCCPELSLSLSPLPFIYLYPASLFPFAFHHPSPAPSFILPSSISLFLYSSVVPFIHPTLPRGVRGWLPVLTALLHYIFSITVIKQTAEPHQKLLLYCRRWLTTARTSETDFTFKTSGHNGFHFPGA